MSITVHNLRTEPLPDDPRHVYVGRAMSRRGLKGSPLRNRNRIAGEWARSYAIETYRMWLLESADGLDWWRQDDQVELHRLTELARSGDLHLYCWCFPLPCHADVIKEEIERRLQGGAS